MTSNKNKTMSFFFCTGSITRQLRVILPYRLIVIGSAYKIFQSLPDQTKARYDLTKQELIRVFHNETALNAFRDSLTARPRKPNENVILYLADIRALVAQAFPTYNAAQREAEALR